jgi:predicted ester cyclase
VVSETTTRSNIEIVREYTERVFNQHNPGLAAKYLAPGVTWHGQTLGTIKGADNVIGMLHGFIGALPDLHAAEQDIVAASDTVAVRYVIEATHDGNLLGIDPTGRRVRWDAVDIYRLVGGMIVEEWAADDATAILYQVGAYTPPWLATSRPTGADGAG